LARAKRVQELEHQIAQTTGDATKAGAGSKAAKDLDAAWTELLTEAPFMQERSDDMQRDLLKARGRDAEAKQIALAQLVEAQGDFSGMRESILVDYEREMQHIEATLEAIA